MQDGEHKVQWRQYFPFVDWLLNYRRENLPGDLIAGVIVTVMLVPQSMAYALLAGLPPQVGIYASIVPLLIYGLLGSSRVLAVGPVAIVSLMVATGVSQFAPASVDEYLQIAITLALLVGGIQLLMGIFHAGFMVNFLSHPVLAGFLNAAAIVIAISQLKHVLGIEMPRLEHTHEQLIYMVEHLGSVNVTTLFIALGSIGLLFYWKLFLADHLKRLNMPAQWIMPVSKAGPLVVVVMGILLVALFKLDTTANVDIVGSVPAGLPGLTFPVVEVDRWAAMFPTALAIALIGYMESISVAKSLASKKRQKVDANQELIALGSANLGAAFTGAYPVAGGIGRSAVNYSAGANTGLASIITALLMGLTVIFLTPLFFYLPRAVLAAIVIVAVIGLFDASVFRSTWRYNRPDAITLGITFAAVLFISVEIGILLGIAVGIGQYLWRTSRPHVAEVGRIAGTEHFRNVKRHDVITHPNVLALRVDESLYFPNAQYLEDVILSAIADDPDIDHLVLICSAVNYIDTSALEVLEVLIEELRDSGVKFYLAEVKGPVMDRLRNIGFIHHHLDESHVFLSTHQAIEALTGQHDRVPVT